MDIKDDFMCLENGEDNKKGDMKVPPGDLGREIRDLHRKSILFQVRTTITMMATQFN